MAWPAECGSLRTTAPRGPSAPAARAPHSRVVVPPRLPEAAPPQALVVCARAARPPSRHPGRSRVVQVHGRTRFCATLRGLGRVFASAGYRFFRSQDAPPAEGDAAWTTHATLPHEPSDTFADGVWYLAVSYFNGVLDSGFLALGSAGEPYLRLDVADGSGEGSPPADPMGVRLEARSGGVVRVHAAACVPASDGATEWALAYSTDGSTPAADAPDVTATMRGRVAVWYNDLPAQDDGATVTVRVQVRRNDGTDESPDWTYSTGADPEAIEADATGPAAPESIDSVPGDLLA